ncbi:hypothetical protein Bca52824_039378 [Brassica carinata]|uniref:Uncharacterized protein n=1 Tax=Brassica carinata TaxID=52824 RepID=A0A8X7UVX0_BRACI|nr:hypothetical protein Bca52824_039378 [Brassica carinata]
MMDLNGGDGSRRRENIDVEREEMDLGVEREEMMVEDKGKGSSGVGVSGCKISTAIFNLYVVRSFASFGGSWTVMKTLRAKIWVLRSLFVRRVGRYVLPDAVVSRLWSRFYLSQLVKILGVAVARSCLCSGYSSPVSLPGSLSSPVHARRGIGIGVSACLRSFNPSQWQYAWNSTIPVPNNGFPDLFGRLYSLILIAGMVSRPSIDFALQRLQQLVQGGEWERQTPLGVTRMRW